MSQVAAMAEEVCTYVSVKIDDQVLPIVKAVAALRGVAAQDLLSDIANEVLSKEIGRKPVKRRPVKPPKKAD